MSPGSRASFVESCMSITKRFGNNILAVAWWDMASMVPPARNSEVAILVLMVCCTLTRF